MNTDPKTLHQLADQLETTAKEIREQANEQARNEILERVIAPGGIFHGEDWHKNFKWIINGPYYGDLVANEFDWERFSSQMHTLASHPKSEEFLKNRFGCTVDILPGHLSFDHPKEYVPFIRKYNIEVHISQEEEWEKQLERSQLVCQLFDEQKATESSSTATDDVEQLRAEVQRLRDIHIDSPMEELFTDGGMSDLRALANDMSDERLAWMTECFCDLLKARSTEKDITDEQLDALEKAANAATPGPWEWDQDNNAPESLTAKEYVWEHGRHERKLCETEADHQFIALANPATIKELVERARKRVVGQQPNTPITFYTAPWDSAMKLAEDLGDDAIVLDLRPFSQFQNPTCLCLNPREFRVSFVTEDGYTDRDQVIEEYRDRLYILTEEEIKELRLKLHGKKVVIPFPHGTAGEVFRACFNVFLTALGSKSEMDFEVVDSVANKQ